MKPLKLSWLSLTQLLKKIGSIPEAIKKAAAQRQRQAVLNEREAERLDRICNPSKYRGK